MTDVQTITTVTKFCVDNLKLDAKLGDEYYKASMPLCVVEAVFSIGVRYEGVKNTIQRLCNYYCIQQDAKDKRTISSIGDQLSTTGCLKLFGDKTPEQLANEVFRNRQRTSTRNAILKAEAVIKFLKVLKDFNAEYFQDIPRLIEDESFEYCIKSIPGQGSGTSLKYFFMLAGSDDLIKPDRMILRFLHRAIGQILSLEQCQIILYGVANELNKQGYNLTPRLLDNIIWNYQRTA